MLKFLTIFGSVALLVGAFSILYVFACNDESCAIFDWQKAKLAANFEECVSFGFPVAESFPRQCRAGDKTFIEDTSTSSDPSFEPDDVSIIEDPTSGLRGLISPSTRLKIYDIEKNLVTVILSDLSGNLETGLEPGTYILEPDDASLEAKIVTVGRGQFTVVDFVSE